MTETEFQVGDRVICRNPGSWTDGKEFVIEKLNVVSTDGIMGHFLKGHGCVTVVEPFNLRKVE